jgi:hypothetical protein
MDEPETGGRYRPTTDDWLATVDAGGAACSNNRTPAVWDRGRDMIVWGGYGKYGADATIPPLPIHWVPHFDHPRVPGASTRAVWTGSRTLGLGWYVRPLIQRQQWGSGSCVSTL